MSVEAFESYEHQYFKVTASLARKCTAAAANNPAEIKSDIDWAEALIRKMDREARDLQPSVRAGFLATLSEYKSDLNILKGALKISCGNAQEALREELLESGMADALFVPVNQESRLLMATKRQNQRTDRLRDSHSTILHAEGIGVDILHDLHQQRESLLHAHDMLHTVDDNLGKSRRIIGGIMRRMDGNKRTIRLIIVLLVLVILVILYFKFVH